MHQACCFKPGMHGLSSAESLDGVRVVEALTFSQSDRWLEVDFQKAIKAGCQIGVFESLPGIVAAYVLFRLVPGDRLMILRMAVRPHYQRRRS